MIRRKFRNAELDEYDETLTSKQEQKEAEYVDDVVLITSEVDEDEKLLYFTSDGRVRLAGDEMVHAPVLDLDFPAALVPSSTPGHYHLYLDTLVPHDKYVALLNALAEAGVIQRGYANASQARGYSAVRAPWVEK